MMPSQIDAGGTVTMGIDTGADDDTVTIAGNVMGGVTLGGGTDMLNDDRRQHNRWRDREMPEWTR